MTNQTEVTITATATQQHAVPQDADVEKWN
ncbi:Uncharacterised protein [Legionella maceachernii]|nr:Uncharacterised protein [Legionella maceachernii]